MPLLKKLPLGTIVINVVVSILIYSAVNIIFAEGIIQTIRLTQIYALVAVTFLYFAILSEPLSHTFNFRFNDTYLKFRKPIAVSALYFGLLHANLAFFRQLGGFEGLGFLTTKYLTAISLGFTTLIVLIMIALISVERFVIFKRLRFWNGIYIAGLLILIHALMLGTHFQDFNALIPQIFFAALAFLFIIILNRFDVFLQTKIRILPRFGVTTTLIIGFVFFSYVYSFLPAGATLPLGIHSQHIKLAQDAQSGNLNPALGNIPNIPGLQGDRTKRYSVDLDFPTTINPNEDVKLSFKVFDASNGNQVILFSKVYGKAIHLIVVDSTLTYFNHIHPEFKDGVFTITTKFPKAGSYHLYADFQPFGAIEQQIASTVLIGKIDKLELSTASPDKNLTKTFGQYEVTLAAPSPLKAPDISIGKQILSFTLRDAQTKQPITNLKPYLEAFGHLVMINQQTFDYIHVHPNDLTVPPPDANGGPTVEFMPLGLYAPIKPGVYRIFAQFNPNNQLFTTDYTINIE